MANNEEEIMKLSPHELIRPFAKTRIWQFMVVAILAHVVIIGITSVGFIKRTITGEAPAVEEPAEPPATPQAPAASTNPPATQAGTATAADALSPDAQHDALMEQRKDTKVIRDITETAAPEEIPSEPDSLGISIEDTAID